MSRRGLIITADDFGLTAGVNRGIEACVRAEAVKSVCAMTNMPHWREVTDLAHSHPEVSIGIHWNVTQGRPVLPPGQVSSLLDRTGEFLPPNRFRQRLRRGNIVLDQLTAELTEQVSRLREAVPAVAFWNTHQNIHVTRGLYALFSTIGKNLGIRAMRSHRRILVREGRSSFRYYLRHPVFWLKGVVLARWARSAARLGTEMPVGRLVNASHPPGHVGLLKALNSAHWEGVAELVTHPADSLDGLAALTHILQTRLDEAALFSARDVAEKLDALGIDLVSFAAVAPESDSPAHHY